nr:hypothetical protein [Halobellus rufus]
MARRPAGEDVDRRRRRDVRGRRTRRAGRERRVPRVRAYGFGSYGVKYGIELVELAIGAIVSGVLVSLFFGLGSGDFQRRAPADANGGANAENGADADTADDGGTAVGAAGGESA